jgi:hypothetical protein
MFANIPKEEAIQNQYEFFIQRMGGPPLYSQRKGDCSHLWYLPVSDLNLLCIQWLLRKLPPHMDSSFILPIESKVLPTVPLKSQELTKLIRHPSLLSDFVCVSWVLANIMTESSCCSWKCDRNSEHRLCMMGIKFCLKFLVVCYIVVSISTASSWCSQWDSQLWQLITAICAEGDGSDTL